MIGSTVVVNKVDDWSQLKADCKRLLIFTKKRENRKLDKLFDKRIDYTLSQVKINDKEISSSKTVYCNKLCRIIRKKNTYCNAME
jgi:hypothetical protein